MNSIYVKFTEGAIYGLPRLTAVNRGWTLFVLTAYPCGQSDQLLVEKNDITLIIRKFKNEKSFGRTNRRHLWQHRALLPIIYII